MTTTNGFRFVRTRPQILSEATLQSQYEELDNPNNPDYFDPDNPDQTFVANPLNNGKGQHSGQPRVNGHPQISQESVQIKHETIPKDKASINDVLAKFKEWVKFDQDLEDSLILSLAVCLSNDVPGDPIWLQIVAPPGSGKTMILMGLQHSERVVYKSSLTPASLVSGFKSEDDPSLLPQLNGKCAVFKDGTELLCLHPDARAQIYGILRGAFDGHVHKSFGNGVQRNYQLHFNMLMGITPAVHADNQASMGERFLRFEMHEDSSKVEGKIHQAISNISKEGNMEEELTTICSRFLYHTVDFSQIPQIPRQFLGKIIALSQLTAMLRATVDRERWGDRDVKYRPSYESGTRIGKQLAKLAAMVAVVLCRPEIDDITYRLVHRVACDSMIGYHKDIISAMCESKLGTDRSNNGGACKEELAEIVKMGATPMFRRLQDLMALKLVESFRREAEPLKKNTPVLRWRVSQHVEDLWKRAKPNK